MKFVVAENTFGCHPSYVIDVPEGDIRKVFPSTYPYTPEEFAKHVKPIGEKDPGAMCPITGPVPVVFVPSSRDLAEQLERARAELLRVAEALATLTRRFEKRGNLVDHYVTALGEIVDGGENPVEIARQALWDDPNRPTGGAALVPQSGPDR